MFEFVSEFRRNSSDSCFLRKQLFDIFCMNLWIIFGKMWEEYKKAFVAKAKEQNKSEKYISRCLEYAYILYEQGIPVIFNQKHLCQLLGYSEKYVYAACNSSKSFYHEFRVQKKSGGYRKIKEPLPDLKNIQRWILDNILYHMEISPYAKAYIKGKSLKDNARFHCRQQVVLSLDISDFFSNISDWMVYENFTKVGYKRSVAMMLTGLCCDEKCLPQGAPTSAALSNIIMKNFDMEVGAFCLENKIRYTRYADDMTFSGEFEPVIVIKFIKKMLGNMGLSLNNSKTRFRKRGQQQKVTGIVVNEKMQVPNELRRTIRQSVYFIEKYGLQSHLERIGENRKNYLSHLKGQVGYALFINPKDEEMKKYNDFLIRLKENGDQL